MKLSVAIIARDEERYIGGCLASAAGLADELVVLLDARSSDRTAQICREHGAHLYCEHWRNFSGQRNRALELCSGEWVLFVDADERVTPELATEIRSLLSKSTAATTEHLKLNTENFAIAAYGIPRYNLFFGRRVRGGGWYPDPQTRLLRRGFAHYDETRLVHEYPLLNGTLGLLQGHLLHYNIDSVGEFWRKQTRFARMEAETLYGEGVRVRHRTFVAAPLREFWRRFVRLGGWHDGWLGLFLCGALAWFEVVKYGRLFAMRQTTMTEN